MAELLQAVQVLPRNQREALALCVWSGVSYADAAAALGIKESSVRARVRKAKAALAASLGGPSPAAAAARHQPEGGPMQAMLPAERELPARGHAALRERLVATVEGDTAPRWRRPVAVAAAAASVMAVGAGLTVWQLTDDGRQGPQRIEPAKPTIPGLSDGERAEIERRCTDLANRLLEYARVR